MVDSNGATVVVVVGSKVVDVTPTAVVLGLGGLAVVVEVVLVVVVVVVLVVGKLVDTEAGVLELNCIGVITVVGCCSGDDGSWQPYTRSMALPVYRGGHRQMATWFAAVHIARGPQTLQGDTHL